MERSRRLKGSHRPAFGSAIATRLLPLFLLAFPLASAEEVESYRENTTIQMTMDPKHSVVYTPGDGFVSIAGARGERRIDIQPRQLTDELREGCLQSISSSDAYELCTMRAKSALANILSIGGLDRDRLSLTQSGKIWSTHFERTSDNAGRLLGPQGPDDGIHIRTATYLARALLLGKPSSDLYATLVETVNQDASGSLVISSFVFLQESTGTVRNSIAIPSGVAGWLSGEYVSLNDKNQIVFVEQTASGYKRRQISVLDKNSPATDRMRRIAASDADLGSTPFDFKGFEVYSAKIDGGANLDRTSNSPITRPEIIAAAQAFQNVTWVVSAANYQPESVENQCAPSAGKTWKRPSDLDGKLGKEVTGLPYRWGGYVSIEEFQRRISGAFAGGSVCACKDPKINYCISAVATGIDCSGFVSRVWNMDRRTTSDLEQVSSPVSWKDLKPGDALNKVGSHVRIFNSRNSFDEMMFDIYESSVSCGGVCQRALPARFFQGYRPRRYKLVEEK
jgi:cell wall-associated NlpC family hydrolase